MSHIRLTYDGEQVAVFTIKDRFEMDLIISQFSISIPSEPILQAPFKMKFTVAVLLVLVAVCLAEEKYTTKYDNVDIDEILKSDRLFKNYYNCLLDKGKCSPEARELKRVLPDALQTECSKCNEKQRAGADKVLRFLIEQKPQEYKDLAAVFDPQDIYINKYRAEAEKRGIKVPQ